MAYVRLKPSWHIPDHDATPESVFLNRRGFLKRMGMGGMMIAGASGISTSSEAQEAAARTSPPSPLPSFERNPAFADVGRPMTDEKLVTTYNNFYEFGFSKREPAVNAKGFSLNPYTLKIDGMVEKPLELDLDHIEQLGYEERVYRFRCVEAWAMTVPWLGVPLKKLIELAKPTSQAKYVAFKSFYDPERAIGQNDKRYKWPYFEGLRIDEAMNEMAFIATGLYGKRLLPQSGTPLRIVLPWKFGYKGPKSIVSMTFTDTQPETFWHEAIPGEYKFYSNVDPQVPHPRWSQAMETHLGDSTKKHPTQWYNGYEKEVGYLYADRKRDLY